jgi:hypothetical protein
MRAAFDFVVSNDAIMSSTYKPVRCRSTRTRTSGPRLESALARVIEFGRRQPGDRCGRRGRPLGLIDAVDHPVRAPVRRMAQWAASRPAAPATPGPAMSVVHAPAAAAAARQRADGAASRSRHPSTTTPGATARSATWHGTRPGRSACCPVHAGLSRAGHARCLMEGLKDAAIRLAVRDPGCPQAPVLARARRLRRWQGVAPAGGSGHDHS